MIEIETRQAHQEARKNEKDLESIRKGNGAMVSCGCRPRPALARFLSFPAVRAPPTHTNTTYPSLESKVSYGDVIQLQHVASGCYLTAYDMAADVDPDCRVIGLVPSSTRYSWFKVEPMLLHRSEGSIVYYNDTFNLVCNTPFQGVSHNLHLTSVQHQFMMKNDGGTRAGASERKKAHQKQHACIFPVRGSRAVLLAAPLAAPHAAPHCPSHTHMITLLIAANVEKRDMKLSWKRGEFEVNCSPEGTPIVLRQHMKVSPNFYESLTNIEAFRLFSPQANAYLQASCDHFKWMKGEREGSTVAHVPHLRVIPKGKKDDPMYQTAKGIWRFERVKTLYGGPIEWEVPVRIRHVASGRLLVVEPEQQVFSIKKSASSSIGADHQLTGTLLDDDDGGSAGIRRTQSVKQAGMLENWYETHLQEPKELSDDESDGTLFYIQVISNLPTFHFVLSRVSHLKPVNLRIAKRLELPIPKLNLLNPLTSGHRANQDGLYCKG